MRDKETRPLRIDKSDARAIFTIISRRNLVNRIQASARIAKFGLSIERQNDRREWIVRDSVNHQSIGPSHKTLREAVTHSVVEAETIVELNIYLGRLALECTRLGDRCARQVRDWLLGLSERTPSAVSVLDGKAPPSENDLERSLDNLIERHGLPITAKILSAMKVHHAASIDRSLVKDAGNRIETHAQHQAGDRRKAPQGGKSV